MTQRQNKTQSTNQRMIVLEMLLTETVYSHMIVWDVLNKYNYLPQQEKSFIKRLYEGTLERQIELDYVVDQYSKVKTDKMKKVIRAIMRMSVYQILYMDAVPDAAACNEAVKLAQKKGFSALKGFVNGVLRNIARNKNNISYNSMSVKYSMPDWIVNLWIEQLGVNRTETVLAGLLEEHPVTIRFREILAQKGVTTETTVDAVQKALTEQGGTMQQHVYLPCAYKVSGTDDLTKLPYYLSGAFVVQDISSMLAVMAIGVEAYVRQKKMQDSDRTKIRVLDLCAAPGGKSMLIADILEQCDVDYAILSRDISAEKVRRMLENFERCNLNHMMVETTNAIEEEVQLVGTADIVIADVPCSGLGVIGKKRDIKYRITPEAVEEVIVLQRQILTVAARYLKAGGRLLFSTCTINQNENEKHFMWLRDALKLTPLSLDDMLPSCLHTETTKNGYLQLLPGVHDADGFFISVFCREDE
jgi:tRNA and rRNA cytosine-C5-methylases